MQYKQSTVTPEYVTIFFDTSDPKNKGWAYNVIIDGEHTSGPLPARRLTKMLPGLLAQLRVEFRDSGVNLPDLPSFQKSHDGLGWESGAFMGRGK